MKVTMEPHVSVDTIVYNVTIYGQPSLPCIKHVDLLASKFKVSPVMGYARYAPASLVPGQTSGRRARGGHETTCPSKLIGPGQ